MPLRKVWISAGVTALAVFGQAGSALAADYLVTLGNSSGSTENIVVGAGDRILVDFAASRSYYCEAIPVATDTDLDLSTSVERLDGAGNTAETLTGREIGSVPAPITADVGDSGDNRISLIPTTTGRYRFTLASTRGGGESAKLRCFATTLFAPFNTTVNEFNFLELTNIGNATCNVFVSIVDQAGVAISTNIAGSVPAGQRRDFDIHSSAGPNRFGFVRVTHDCPLGTLGGGVSQYSGTVTDFELSVSLPLTTFDQRP